VRECDGNAFRALADAEEDCPPDIILRVRRAPSTRGTRKRARSDQELRALKKSTCHILRPSRMIIFKINKDNVSLLYYR